jgi:hypothetical protein
MSLVWKIFALIFALGVILVFVAAAIPLYPQSVISKLQSNLDSGQLSQQDTWDQEASLRWWKLALWQTYQPMSSFINSAGLLMIILSVSYGVFALAYGRISRKVSDEKKPLLQVVEKEPPSVVPTSMVQAVVETKPEVKPEGKASEYTAKARWYSYYVKKSGSSTPSQVEDSYKEEPREDR